MSKSNLNQALGCYGKLPCTGDFFHRNLPVPLIQSWEHWLQHNLFNSQRELGDEWREKYLTCPFWRFYLPEQLAAEHAYLGVICPSVDSVGRYFPLTVLLALPPASRLQVFTRHCQDFLEHIEETILAALDQQINNVDEFIEACLRTPVDVSTLLEQSAIPSGDHSALDFSPTWQAAEVVSAWTMSRSPPQLSWWWCEGSHQRPGVIQQINGLPDKNTFIHMLCGEALQEPMHLPDLPARAVDRSVNPAHHNAAESPDTESSRPPEIPVTRPEYDEAPATGLTPPEIPLAAEPDHEDPLAGAALLSENLNGALSAETDGDAEEPLLELTGPSGDCVVLKYHSTHFSETGPIRDHNEDSLLDKGDAGLWVVADGMGGHSHGELASQEITKQLARVPLQGDLVERTNQVLEALQQINTTVFNFATDKGTTCGSTVVATLGEDTRFAAIWAGDSRLYHFSGSGMTQITRDHDGSELNAGAVDPAMPKQTNMITRAVGIAERLDAEVRYFSVNSFDRLLLCSDGVYGCVRDEDLKRILRTDNDIDSAKTQLYSAILEGGADDNFSAVIIDIIPAIPES